MKLKFLLLLCLFSLTVSAETSQILQLNNQRADIDKYVDENLPKVKYGELPASEFYKVLYDKFANSNFDDKGFQMQSIYSAIDKAVQYESGKITKEEFDLFKLKLRADMTAHDDDMKLKQQQHQQNIETSQPEYKYTPIQIPKPVLVNPSPPKQTNCTTNGNFTNCTTY